VRNTEAQETEKYARIWEHPDYGKWSPGEQYVDLFLELRGDRGRHDLIDIGCGSGKALMKLRDAGFDVTGLDLVRALPESLDIPVLIGPVWSHRTWQRQPPTFEQLWLDSYCTDVLEHIPTEYIALTLAVISAQCRSTFFSISNVSDHFGSTIGQPLHLTVRPFTWWKQRIEESGGKVLHARDLMTDSIFFVEWGSW